jgi:formate dehydrogenase subunit delta
MPPTVRLANDIAEQFTRRPHDEAARAIANHINQFWPPPMRRDFLALVEQRHADLSDLARECAQYVRPPAP